MKWLLSDCEDEASRARYEGFVRECGAEPFWMPSWRGSPPLGEFDAFLLTGGGDVDPALYGAPARDPATHDVDRERDEKEFGLIRAFLSRGKPVFGICRGLQVLNVCLGGGLIQHLPRSVPESEERHTEEGSGDSAHPVFFDLGTELGRALLGKVREVNSAHHQAADPERLGRGLRVAARTRCGVIEALESQGPPSLISAVQWHPERLPAEHPGRCALARHWRERAARAG